MDDERISNPRFADDIVLLSTSTAEFEEMLNERNVAESGVCLASSQRSSGMEELWSPLRQLQPTKGASKYQSKVSKLASLIRVVN